MGDDLKAAEDFITSAMFQLKPLLSGETASDRLPLDGLLHISDQAMTIHARGIARAAESVITAIKDEAGEAAVNGRLMRASRKFWLKPHRRRISASIWVRWKRNVPRRYQF